MYCYSSQDCNLANQLPVAYISTYLDVKRKVSTKKNMSQCVMNKCQLKKIPWTLQIFVHWHQIKVIQAVTLDIETEAEKRLN